MTGEFTSKRCLVLGGSGALGQVVCRRLREAGASVAFTWNSTEVGIEDCVALKADLRDVKATRRVVDEAGEQLGGLEALVHCAAIWVTDEDRDNSLHEKIEEVDEHGWNHVMEVNVRSAFFACQQALPLLRVAGGNIVLTGSIDSVKPVPSPAHYAASKGALDGMVKSMSKELGPDKVCANVVAPGLMEAGLSRMLPAKLKEDYNQFCALKRPAQLPEIASVIAWLALENTYVTGQTWLVDGAL